MTIDINENAGLWSVKGFHSGTYIVTSENADLPHYYVYGDERFKVCQELAGFLNFSERPHWMSNLKRDTKISCKGDFGILISATGPMILPPNDDGRLNWQQDPKKEQHRKALIDGLVRKEVKNDK